MQNNSPNETPSWSPRLEELTRKLGDYVERQVTDMVDPKASAGGTVLRVLFRTAVKGGSLLKKTYKEAGLAEEGPASSMWADKRLSKLVELAEKNGSDAAAKIKRGIEIVAQVRHKYDSDSTVTNTATLPDALRRLRVAKKQGLTF